MRFESTPAQQSGLPPVWSDPLANLTGPTQDPDDVAQPGQSHNTPGTSIPSTTTPGSGVVGGHGLWLPISVGVAAVALLGAAVLLLVRRRRRPVELTSERAWHHLRRTLSKHASIAWSDATTPRAAVRTVQTRLTEQTGSGLDGPALDALTRLATAVEQERYAPRPTPTTSAELHHWLGAVRHGVEQKVSDRSRRADATSALPTGS